MSQRLLSLNRGAHRESGVLPGWLLLSFLGPLLLVGALSFWVETEQYHLAVREVTQEANQAGMTYGAQIANRLMAHYAELEFVAVELLGSGDDPTTPDAKTVQTLRRFMATHPGLYAFNVQSADGNRILWSTKQQSSVPIDKGGDFTALAGNADLMLGQDQFAPRIGFHVLTTRYRLRDPSGKTRYFVGTPYRLDYLLAGVASRIPWDFAVIDTRDGSVLGIWRQDRVHFDRPDLARFGKRLEISGYPLAVRVAWPKGLVRERYLEAAPSRWVFEVGAFLLLLLAVYWVTALLQRRAHDALRLQRLSDFNALLAQASQVVADSTREDELFQAICDLAIRYGHLKLAWVGRPDDAQRFQFIAAGGGVSYIDGLFISADPSIPEGQGSGGRTWRDGRAYYSESFGATATLKPWQARAEQWGLRASATLPILQNGRTVAVLAVFHERANIWDDDLRRLLEELAQAISNGLDRLEAAERKRQLEQDLESARVYQRTLFERNAAGILIIDAQRIIVDVNTSLCEMTGFPAEVLIGQSLAMLYADDRPFDDFADFYESRIRSEASIQLMMSLQRSNGETLTVQALGTEISLPQGGSGVLCSMIDITALQAAREQVQRQALHDILTDLPNRRALDNHLPLAIARAQRNQGVVAVGMMDLDNFKPVNDTWGHTAGDRLLKELGLRLKKHLRETDLLARLGGDEFVIVIEDLDADRAAEQLSRVLDRLHRAVESPFDVAPGAQAIVGLSLGVALFPFDGTDGDSLLRQADAAMYRAKQNKQHRQNWWQPSVSESDETEAMVEDATFDVFGEDAIALLSKSQPYLKPVTDRFIEHFYTELSQEAQMHSILRNFTTEQVRTLMTQQAAYLQFLLAPATTQAMIHERARYVGQVHALVGVSAVLLTQMLSLYRRLLSEQLKEFQLPTRTRYRLLQTAEARLQADLEIQLDMEGRVLSAYFDHLSRPMPAAGTSWIEASALDIDWLGDLPGIQGAILMRLSPEGVFTVERSAGPHAARIAAVLGEPGREAVVDPDSPRGQGLSAQAWRSLQILSTPSYALDPRYRAWHTVAEPLGLRSALSVPILNAAGQAEAVVSLFGAYPNQFESTTIQHFARGLQQRWEQIWQRCSTPAPVIPEEQAISLRRALFSGGLRMFMQPVVSLSTGKLVKAEALARLQMPDGQIIPPGVFLPLLGQADLDHLFQLGLVAALTELTRWEAAGLSIDIAVNLPPSNLLDAECPHWVAETLSRFNVSPGRLTLELLETQSMDVTHQDKTIAAFLDLGVKLAMDDLGSGYSSLLRLSKVPFHTIKIDQGLLLHIRENPVQAISLIASILQMGKDFDREVVAEGLEDLGMIEAVTQLGAVFGQGYGIARPMPADELLDWSPPEELPVDVREIRTFLGALAYQWRVMHQRRSGHGQPDAGCPLMAFLRAYGRTDPIAAEWHAQLQAAPSDSELGARLLSWLAEQVHEEQVRVACVT